MCRSRRVAAGQTNEEIAGALVLSVRTVRPLVGLAKVGQAERSRTSSVQIAIVRDDNKNELLFWQ